MRLLRIAGGAAAGLLLTALLAAWLAPRFLDWSRYRDAIASVASTTLGRPVQITGPLSLTLLPHTVLVASGVTVADPGDGASADIPELRLQVALGPLLAGRLEAEDLTLQGARIRLPWPFRGGALQQPPPTWLTGLRARVEDGTLLIGGLTVAGMEGTLAVDPLTGTFAMDGLAAALGRRWRVTARLGRAGGDGSAPLEVSLDGQDQAAGTAQDTGGTLSGQIAPDGSLAGRVTGRGSDLSQLIPAPALPWHAAGRFRGGDGLALADELDVEIGGVPARGAVALRLLPEARLDAALATSRLDLGAWLTPVLRGNGASLPTSVDLSAEAATLAGGTLRHLRVAFDLGPDGVGVRDAEAVLPGAAAATLSGHLARGRFTGTAALTAPAFRETLRWLEPAAPALAGALPPDALQTANLTSKIALTDGTAVLDDLSGSIDGSAVTGALTLTGGLHPAVSGKLTLDGLNLDPWLPKPATNLPALAAGLLAWPGRWGGLDIALTVSAARPVWHGAALDTLALDAALQAGTLTVRHAALAGPDFRVQGSFSLAPGGHVADLQVKGTLDHASELQPLLPRDWPSALFKGPAAVQARASGDPGALGLTLQAGLADLQLDATGTANLPAPAWTGTLDLRHPGAPRLLEALGVPGLAPWLGDGSFSLATALAASPSRVALSGLTLSAGMLRTAGDLTLDRAGWALTGQLDADTLPLPLPYARSPEPLPIDWLRGWRAQLAVKAAHVLFGLSPGIDQAAASVSLSEGALRVTGLTGAVAGGKLAGQAELDAAAPPRLLLQGTLTGATLVGTLLDGPLDVTAGSLDASAALQASGFSPNGLLATLDGTAQASVSGGVLTGFDLAGVTAALDQPAAASAGGVQSAVAKALGAGSTDFTTLSAGITVHQGTVVLHQGTLTAAAGSAALSGTLDLPIVAADLTIAITPARANAPAIGLRLIGAVANPRRTPELAKLAGWLAER